MDRITTTMTKKEAWHTAIHGLNDARKGIGFIIGNVAKAVAHSIDRAAHRSPWLFMAAEAIIAITIGYYFIGSARAQRDQASRTSYAYHTTADSLQILLDLKNQKQ